MQDKSFAVDTSIIFGTTILSRDVEYNIQSVNLPGLSLNHPELRQKSGAPMFAQSDSLTYNELTMTIILDEKFVIWSELVNHFHKMVTAQDAVLTKVEGDSYVSITDTSGNVITKIWFRNSKIETMGDLSYGTTLDNDNLVVDITMKYDYMEIEPQNIDTSDWDLTEVEITADAVTDVDGNYTGDVVTNVLEP